MDLIEGLMTTRAMRRYSDEPVSDEEIITCLRAALQAPSGGNIQPWQFLVVTDPQKRARLGEIYRRAYTRYEAAMLPTVPPFRDEEQRAGFDRTVAASRHLADHLGSAPVILLFLMPSITMTLSDEGGDLDVGTPYASLYPAVQRLLREGWVSDALDLSVFTDSEIFGWTKQRRSAPARRLVSERAAAARSLIARSTSISLKGASTCWTRRSSVAWPANSSQRVTTE